MKVRDATRKPPVTANVDETIAHVAHLMDEAAVGAVVVIDPFVDRPVGIVTDRDLVTPALARNVPLDARIDDVMSGGLVCIDADADLHEAYALFKHHAVRRLAVVQGHEVVGVLSVDDALVNLTAQMSTLGDELHGVVRGVTAQVLFGHREPQPPARV
jgi:signal-transduction protein with cAMP-binding, CBS, and nucleotidyltransferase domain